MKIRIIHKLYNALTTQYSENGSGFPILEPVPTWNHNPTH